MEIIIYILAAIGVFSLVFALLLCFVEKPEEIKKQSDIVELSYVNTDENLNFDKMRQYFERELERRPLIQFENEQEEPTNEEMIEYFDNEIENYNKIQLEQPKINKIDSEIII